MKQTTGKELRRQVTELRERLGKMGLDRAATHERIEMLKEVAPEYVALRPVALGVLRELNQQLGGDPGYERWRRNPELRADGEAAEEVISFCRENPFVGDILATQRREAVSKLREQAAINLHEALEGKTGKVAVRVTYPDKHTGKQFTRWLLFEANTEGHDGQGHVVESFVPFLTGTNRNGEKIWFDLGTPSKFAEIRSADFRQALIGLYEFEEKIIAREAKTKEILSERTISLTEAMAGKKGRFACHHQDWKTPKGGGPLTYSGDATGTALVLQVYFAPNGQIDLSGLTGKKQPLKNLDSLFGKVVRYRLDYEANQAKREADGKIEPSAEEPQS